MRNHCKRKKIKEDRITATQAAEHFFKEKILFTVVVLIKIYPTPLQDEHGNRKALAYWTLFTRDETDNELIVHYNLFDTN